MERELSCSDIRNFVFNYFYKERNDAEELLSQLGKSILFNVFNLERAAEKSLKHEKEKYGYKEEDCDDFFLKSKSLYNICNNGITKLYNLEETFKKDYYIKHGFDTSTNITFMYFENNILRYQYFNSINDIDDKIEVILGMIYTFIGSTGLEATKENIEFYLNDVIVKIIEKINFLYKKARKINEEIRKNFNDKWNSGDLNDDIKMDFILNLGYVI